MEDIQCPTAKNRRGKKKDNLRKIKRKKKPQDENIMACPIPYRTAMKKKIKTIAAKYNAGRP